MKPFITVVQKECKKKLKPKRVKPIFSKNCCCSMSWAYGGRWRDLSEEKQGRRRTTMKNKDTVWGRCWHVYTKAFEYTHKQADSLLAMQV